MGIFDYDEVITAHSIKQAVADGVLVEISSGGVSYQAASRLWQQGAFLKRSVLRD